MKTLNEFDKHFKDLIAKDATEKSEVEKNIAEVNEKLEEANKRLSAAEESGDYQEYINVKKEIENLTIFNEMNNKKLDKVTNKPLLERAEFLTTLKEIEKAADAEQEKLKEKAYELLLELKKIADKSSDLALKTDDLCKVLCLDIIKGEESYKYDSNGAMRFFYWPDYPRVNKTFVYGFYDMHVKNTIMDPEKKA
ncbi:hypothetical protein ACFKP6_06975 [Streptococcus uberis]|uniref:hypothetical protein n=1 Tax=Streptococcus uberis TaxID=1349 RepID=UPI0038D3C7A7